jgi:hypothetical protein
MAKQKNSPPAFAKNAVPTVRGWADPKTGEILVSQRGLPNVDESFEFRRDRGLGRKEVDAQMPDSEVEEVAPKAPEAPVVEEVVEAPAAINETVEEVLTEQVEPEAPSAEDVTSDEKPVVKPAPKKRRSRKKKA